MSNPEDKGEFHFPIVPMKSALIIVDMQNVFLEEGAARETPSGRAIIPNVKELLEYFREHHLAVVWTRSDHRLEFCGPTLRQRWESLEPEQIPQRFENRVTHAFRYYSEMGAPTEGEHQVVKHKYDAFMNTNLDTLLRNAGVDTVIIAGVSTTVCCQSTARGAFERDYKVVFVSDATATRDVEDQESTVRLMSRHFGRVLSTKELLTELKETDSKTCQLMKR
jgi:ureidoacrylate peracid hydrolase